ncbi:cob(I)yrinic acid a,c-diamide adenosyltransferase [Gammaproteobacteria bacterium]|nr:cob(I)yrinic acid a,c-diamide adenosyltransferase [Gammaproteobacteria bacterium]
MTTKNGDKHKTKMKSLKKNIDNSILNANISKGVGVLLTGNGKGKTSSAFGMAIRALGYDYEVAIIQFIKGKQLSGEEIFIKENFPKLTFHQMNTGFTWDTQDKKQDILAAKETWKIAKKALNQKKYHLVILDELTYMLSFKYLDETEVIKTLKGRPKNQSVVVTGRGGGKSLKEWADTVSEVRDIKHAFNSNIMARKGVDY